MKLTYIVPPSSVDSEPTAHTLQLPTCLQGHPSEA